jgi:hypothetical protein
MTDLVTRRRALATLGGGGLLLAGCDRIERTKSAQASFKGAEDLTYRFNRLITPRDALAPEFSGGDISPIFRSNGNSVPRSPDYARLLADGFRDYRLQVTGLVARPLSISLPCARRLAESHADHASRLCRGLERDRQVDRHAADVAAQSGGAIVGGTLHRLPLLRRFQRHRLL